MKPEKMKPSLRIQNQNEKALSGKALAVLLAAVLDKGIPFRFKARGFSMSPMIQDGDVITICSFHPEALHLGDVVAIFYARTEKFVVHRLIDRKGDFFIVKGDNNPGPDEQVSQDQIVGRVKRIERNGRRIHFGLGKERYVIAWLMRNRLFLALIRKSRMIKKVFDA